jgi:hypothetical protein
MEYNQRDKELALAKSSWRTLLMGIRNIAKASGQTKKAFISYAWPEDKAETEKLQQWLSQLEADLELAGISTFLDIRDMSGGLEETMLAELNSSDFIIPILTPRFLERAHDPKTNLAFEFRQTMERFKKSPACILPILREGGFRDVIKDELADLSKGLIYTIQSNVKTEPFLVNLSNPLGLIPVIYGWNHVLRHEDRQVYQDLLTAWYASSLNHLPQPLPNAIEREELMKKLQASVPIQVIQGMGGVGKTQLAVAHAHQCAKDKAFIYWINADKVSFPSDWSRLGIALGVNLTGLSMADQKREIRLALREKENWLIILDNLADKSALEDLLPQELSPTQQVLITTRSQNWDYPILNVPPFTPNESQAYFATHVQKSGLREGSEALAATLGHLPLALAHVVAYIKKIGRGAEEYHRLYKKTGISLLTESTQSDPDYPFTICSTYLSSVDQLVEENPQAAEMIKFSAYLYPAGLKGRFLKPLLAERERQAYDRCIADARRVGLLTETETGNGWTIHPLVQAAIRYNETGDIFAKRLQTIAETLIALKTQTKDPTKIRELQPHLETILDHLQSFMAAKDTTEVDKERAHACLDRVLAVMEKEVEEKAEAAPAMNSLKVAVKPEPDAVENPASSATPTKEYSEMAAEKGRHASIYTSGSSLNAGRDAHIGDEVHVAIEHMAVHMSNRGLFSGSASERRLAALTSQKESLEKEKEALFGKTAIVGDKKYGAAVKNEEGLSERITQLKTLELGLGDDFAETLPKHYACLRQCNTIGPLLKDLDEKIKVIEEEISKLTGVRDELQANMKVKNVQMSGKGDQQLGHQFSAAAVANRGVRAGIEAEGVNMQSENGNVQLGHKFV